MRKLLAFGFLFFAVIAFAAQPAQAQVTGVSWTAAFYNNTMLNGDPVAVESYPYGIYFNWGEGTPYNADYSMPVTGVDADNFSVRFTSTQTFIEAGTYVFTIFVDDGMRVFLDNVPVIDQFNQNPTPEYRTFTFEHEIAANQPIDMRVELVEFTGSALFTFQWGRRTAPPPIYINAPFDGETVSGDFAPTFSWQHTDAPSYLFRLFSGSGKTLLKVNAPASEICVADVCSIDSGTPPGRAGIKLENDEYAWQVKAQGVALKQKSARIEFRISYPGRPVNLTPDLNATFTGSSPLLQWTDVTAANQYKIVLTRVKNGATIKTRWLSGTALACDGSICAFDPAAYAPRFVFRRGPYAWRVLARNTAFKVNLSKSKLAKFEFVPQARSAPLPAPEAPEGFRAP